MNVAACATTGLAANDLIDGTTAHSRFRIPLDVKEAQEPQNMKALQKEIIAMTDLIILDEVSALHKNVLQYIDKTCRVADLLRAKDREEDDLPFAGKVFFSYFSFIQTFLHILIIDCYTGR